jgi:aminopeptidase N
MKWWSDLWLKEGFATFCQYVFFDNVQPEFKVMLDFVSDVTSGGQKADEIKSSHSIEVHVNEPCDLESYYDAITYFKSSAVIYMLYKYLGEDTFRDGLRRYIKKFAYSNAETLDLWSALSDASGQKINEIMDTWTKQMGFPLVTVEGIKLSLSPLIISTLRGEIGRK